MGRGLKTLCMKISYGKPSGAESREGSSTLAENSRVFLGYVFFDSDWLTKCKAFRAWSQLVVEKFSVLGEIWVFSAIY